MQRITDQYQQQLTRLCRQFCVARLDLFGSAATAMFDPARSDVDFLVEFADGAKADLFHNYFGLHDALEQLLGRRVDLVMVGALRNPYFVRSANQSRQLVYAA